MTALAIYLLTPTKSVGDELMLPPSSFRPKAAQQRVLISHRHRRVRACVKVSTSAQTACLPQLGEGNTATTVFLEPLRAPDGSAAHARRVTVVFKSAVGRQEQAIQLVVGQWSVDWPGASGSRRLLVTAEKLPSVRLLTTSGRCELMTTACVINETYIEQRVAIDD
ncbi:MAG TPA: hypothetical protein VJN18_20830 [Polyangiaceae bacterium]|nr:hypothetical protein [Polyangiaceae bacterium]